MITVSEKFRKLAQDNGREVWCRITVGSEEFLDDRITDMTFDDVIHPRLVHGRHYLLEPPAFYR